MVIKFNYLEARKKIEISVYKLISKYRLPPPLILREDESIEHLINALVKYRRECALVSDDAGKVVGIVTLFDLLKLFIDYPRTRIILRHPRIKPESEKSPLSTIMSPNPVKVGVNLKLKEVLELMVRYGISHVVVIDPKTKKPVTIISKKMILSELLGTEVIKDLTNTL